MISFDSESSASHVHVLPHSSPRRRFGGHKDLFNASDLLDYISGSQQVSQARLMVASLEGCNLVERRREQIVAVAAALLKHKTLTAKQVREAILESMGTKRTMSVPEGWTRPQVPKT
jgi:hypothetical protein